MKKNAIEFLETLGWALRRCDTSKCHSRWAMSAARTPEKVIHFASLGAIEDFLKRQVQLELAFQSALKLLESIYCSCGDDERAALDAWMISGDRRGVWDLTETPVNMTHLVVPVPRRWREAAAQLLPSRSGKSYEPLWKRASEHFAIRKTPT